GGDHARGRRERAGRDGVADGDPLLCQRRAVVPGGSPARAARARGGLVMSTRRSSGRPAPAPALRAARPGGPLIAVEVGNTETALGVFRGADLESQWRVTSRRSTGDELRLLLESMLGTSGAGAASVLSSVVPALTRPWTEALRAVTG